MDGFAACLDDALSPSSPFLPADDDADSCGGGDANGGGASSETTADSGEADVRASLVLQLLLDSVSRGGAGGPGLGHLLLSFDVMDGPAGDCKNRVEYSTAWSRWFVWVLISSDLLMPIVMSASRRISALRFEKLLVAQQSRVSAAMGIPPFHWPKETCGQSSKRLGCLLPIWHCHSGT